MPCPVRAFPRRPFLLLALLAWMPGTRCLAGDSYLDRNSRVQEAVPYGSRIDGPEERGRKDPGNPRDTPSTTTPPEQGSGGAGYSGWRRSGQVMQ